MTRRQKAEPPARDATFLTMLRARAKTTVKWQLTRVNTPCGLEGTLLLLTLAPPPSSLLVLLWRLATKIATTRGGHRSRVLPAETTAGAAARCGASGRRRSALVLASLGWNGGWEGNSRRARARLDGHGGGGWGWGGGGDGNRSRCCCTGTGTGSRRPTWLTGEAERLHGSPRLVEVARRSSSVVRARAVDG